jgi:hypothetical protein
MAEHEQRSLGDSPAGAAEPTQRAASGLKLGVQAHELPQKDASSAVVPNGPRKSVPFRFCRQLDRGIVHGPFAPDLSLEGLSAVRTEPFGRFTEWLPGCADC